MQQYDVWCYGLVIINYLSNCCRLVPSVCVQFVCSYSHTFQSILMSKSENALPYFVPVYHPHNELWMGRFKHCNVNVNNKFIERTGTRVASALGCQLQYYANRNVFNWCLNCLLKVQDHADIQVSCSRW